MTIVVLRARWYAIFKLSVFLLLVANAIVYAKRGTWSEGVDSAAWLALLLLFELETVYAAQLQARHAVAAVRATRLVAGAAVLAAAVGYLQEKAWLDAANAWLWIAVVILLEIEVRSRLTEPSRRRVFGTVATTLYLGLLGMVIAWLANGEWFNAYDAALWLIAFVTIEMNVMGLGAATRRTAA